MLSSTVHGVALIFEGGGMRNSYSAGALCVMLENGLFFDDVYGLSAGSQNVIDYLSRDADRAEAAFTASFDGLSFRRWLMPFVDSDGISASLRGDGVARVGCRLPFDFKTFYENPARATIQAIERDTGKTRYFVRRDFSSEKALMKRVAASSSYPIVLPPTMIDGCALYDGGVGEGAGIMIPRARADGFEKYFVVCTRPRGFRRSMKPNRVYDAFFWHRPAMRAAMNSWNRRYNEALDDLERLESGGSAYVFYANDQGVSNVERDIEKLTENFKRGRDQARGELDAWERFLRE